MRKFLPMLIIFFLIALVFLVVFRKKEHKPSAPKPQPVAVSKYSDSFNLAVQHVLNDYYALSEAFVNWDSGAIGVQAKNMDQSSSQLHFDELKKDTAIYETAISYKSGFNTELQTIQQQNIDITEKRRSFQNISMNLFDLLRTIRYDGGKVFLQECPMAFNDSETAVWLSNKSEIRNPYLGLHHPKYKSGMLVCGDTKDSLRFGSETK